MATRLLPCAACAALTILGVPVSAQPISPAPLPFRMFGAPSDSGVNAFYASRNGMPLWLAGGPGSAAARELIGILKRSSLEGFLNGPAIAAQAEALTARASAGDQSALLEADRLLSSGWIQYVQMLGRPPAGMTYAEQWIAPRAKTPNEILLIASAARSLETHVRSMSEVNPFYSTLRQAAWQQMQQTGTAPDPRVLANLERLRPLPARGRYVVVDAAGARLWMVDNGQVVDSMKVIVGKPSTQTPMLASVIHYATLNPYWNVPPDLVQRLIAHNVLSQGLGYLKSHGYQILSGSGADAELVPPAKVDWKAVADGRATVRVRQLPGPGNSMGRLKFPFPNADDVYLHDTPQKELFAQNNRDISNGCIRLEDAARLGRWLMGGELSSASGEPEQHVLLPRPVPIYLTYLTARAEGGQLTLLDDVYGRDAQRISEMAALH